MAHLVMFYSRRSNFSFFSTLFLSLLFFASFLFLFLSPRLRPKGETLKFVRCTFRVDTSVSILLLCVGYYVALCRREKPKKRVAGAELAGPFNALLFASSLFDSHRSYDFMLQSLSQFCVLWGGVLFRGGKGGGRDGTKEQEGGKGPDTCAGCNRARPKKSLLLFLGIVVDFVAGGGGAGGGGLQRVVCVKLV